MKFCENELAYEESKPFIYFKNNVLFLRFKDGLFISEDYEKMMDPRKFEPTSYECHPDH